MTDRSDNDDTNVEGIACLIASQLPLEDPPACRQICKLLPELVEMLVASHTSRSQHPPKQ